MKFIPLLMLLTACLYIGCNDNGGNENCNEIACTEIFAFLTVKVVDSDGQAVALDSYRVILSETGTDITPDNSDSQFLGEEGTYIVFSDNYVEEYQNDTTIIRFTGFIDSEEVASSEFTVGADCCHVKMISESNIVTTD